MSAGSTYLRGIVEGWSDPLAEEYWTRLGSFGHAALADHTTYFWAAADAPAMADAVGGRDLAAVIEQRRRVLPAAAGLLQKVPSFEDLLVNTVRGSTAGAGSQVAWCSSATRLMRWLRTWAREPITHWLMRWR